MVSKMISIMKKIQQKNKRRDLVGRMSAEGGRMKGEKIPSDSMVRQGSPEERWHLKEEEPPLRTSGVKPSRLREGHL